MILGIHKWQEVKGVITPGGDPCWRCPSCGGDEHVCGIESLYTSHNECKECKTKLIYPWENCETGEVKFQFDLDDNSESFKREYMCEWSDEDERKKLS